MGHVPIILSLVLGLGAVAQFERPVAAPATASVSQADPLRDVMAAAVIQRLQAEFAGREVEFKFDSFASEPASQRDLVLRGSGQFRLEGGRAWLPMQYEAIYDTATAGLENPDIRFGAQHGKAAVDVDVATLDAAVDRRLADEFASQAVAFELGPVRSTGGDARYALVQAYGIADFAGEGAAQVTVQATFDRATREWLQVDYALGDALDSASGLVATAPPTGRSGA